MKTPPSDQIMDTTTLTFRPPGGFPQEVQIEGLTMQDVVFSLAFLHAHSRSTSQARISTAEALKRVREVNRVRVATEVDLAVENGLGRWSRLLPRRVIDAVVNQVLDKVGDIRPETMAELHDTYSRVIALSRRQKPPAAAQVALPSGPSKK